MVELNRRKTRDTNVLSEKIKTANVNYFGWRANVIFQISLFIYL